MRSLAIFDLDGTLVNSLQDLANSVNYALTQFNCPSVSTEYVRNAIGNGAFRLIQDCLPTEKKDLASNALDSMLPNYLETCTNNTNLYEGVHELLTKLKSQNTTLAVLTNKPIEPTLKILKALGIDHFFSTILGGDSLSEKKPSPVGIQHILDISKKTNSDAIMIGDGVPDILSAQNANIQALAILSGIGKAKDLKALKPDYTINHFSELLNHSIFNSESNMPENKYHMVTFGCQMNEYDSNLIAQSLEDCDAKNTDDIEDADIVVVNTCSIREKAEDTAMEKIDQLRYLKKRKPNMKIAVVGCMAKNKGDGIPTSLDHVDVVLGPDNYKDLDQIFFGADAASARKKRLEKSYKVITDFDEVENYEGQKAKLASKYSTFITIQRGCNKRCTYCIVPFVRGNEKYRSTQDILDEVKFGVDQGIKEVTLLGQTVNSYRYEGDTFASLLMKVSEVAGVERVRFTSPHPKHFSDDLIWTIGNRDNISKHAHLPVQSGSSRILKEMRRQYDREDFLAIAEKLRKAAPGFALSTDVIVGYVGETEADFQETVSLVNEVRFDSAFMFAYSPREGTKAFGLKESLTEDQKKARLAQLIEIQNKITFEKNAALIGQSKKVLIEGPSHRNPLEMMGKTDCFKKVILPENYGAKPGDIISTYIDEIRGWTLRGTPTELKLSGF